METHELQTESPDFELYFQVRNHFVKKMVRIMRAFRFSTGKIGYSFTRV